MSPATPPRIIIATQAVEGSLPALRLLKICAEFGPVAIMTPQAGPAEGNGVKFERILTGPEWFYRSLRVLCRKLGCLLPRGWREKWIEGFTEEALGVLRLGKTYRRTWRRLKLKPDLLVLDGAEFMSTAGKLAREAGIPVVYYVHEMFPNQRAHYSRTLSNWFCKLESRECRHAQHIIVQHHLWGKLLRRRYRLAAAKFTEVTPSPDPQEPQPGSAPPEPLRLYYHGLFTDDRGLESLIKAVGLVPGVALDLRGTGPHEEALRRSASLTGAVARIQFLPPLPTDQLAESGRAYDLGVVTGTREHLNGRMAAGMKLYENIAAGIGIFGYRAITLRDTVRGHGIGFVYDGSSPEKAAVALRECLARRVEIPAMRQRAAAVARTYFNSDMQYERLRQVIAAALASASNTQP